MLEDAARWLREVADGLTAEGYPRNPLGPYAIHVQHYPEQGDDVAEYGLVLVWDGEAPGA